MNSFNKFRAFSAFFIAVILCTSCKGPETIVVNENPTTVASAPSKSDSTEIEPGIFQQLNIGEINPVPSLDPLFADNNSTLRTIQLVFEGLVRYDENNTIIPAAAKKWSVSSDSLTYRFTLKNNIYYHDSNVFSNGTGRKLLAEDVKKVFQRMARIDVPDKAAHLFMNIEGFEPYYQEHHHILNPDQRELDSIKGISTPNDSTVTFSLIEKDPRFIDKLATPYAVIYPMESVTEGHPSKFEAVGSGPFELSKHEGDSLYIFAKYKNYYNADVLSLSRVDVKIQKNEVSLFRALTRENIHLIPELGPQLIQGALDTTGELKAGYKQQLKLTSPGGQTQYTFFYNPGSYFSKNKINFIAQKIIIPRYFKNLPGRVITYKKLAKEQPVTSLSQGGPYYATYSPDPFIKSFISDASRALEQQRVIFKMLRIRTPVRNSGLYAVSEVAIYSSTPLIWPDDPDALAGLRVSQQALYINKINHLQFNRLPWWIDLRSVSLPGIDTLGK